MMRNTKSIISLKWNQNTLIPNGEIVLKSKLNHVELSFLKNCKNYNQLYNESYKFFFQEDTLIAQKTRLSIIFS